MVLHEVEIDFELDTTAHRTGPLTRSDTLTQASLCVSSVLNSRNRGARSLRCRTSKGELGRVPRAGRSTRRIARASRRSPANCHRASPRRKRFRRRPNPTSRRGCRARGAYPGGELSLERNLSAINEPKRLFRAFGRRAVREAPGLARHGSRGETGGGCLACCFGGGSGREEVPSADDGEASVSSRRETATASAIAAREKDEASLASRRALANAEPVAEEDAFLREPRWDDTKDDVSSSRRGTARRERVRGEPGRGRGTFAARSVRGSFRSRDGRARAKARRGGPRRAEGTDGLAQTRVAYTDSRETRAAP